MVRRMVLWLGVGVTLAAVTLSGMDSRAFTAGRPAPEISGGPWLNSQPLTVSDLKGRVVLLQFWTYG